MFNDLSPAFRIGADPADRSALLAYDPHRLLNHRTQERAGLVSTLMEIARNKEESAYLGDGKNHWPSVHRDDAAHLFHLALEKGKAGGTYHAVAKEGIPFRDIAQVIGERLNVPVVGKPSILAKKLFGFLAPFI